MTKINWNRNTKVYDSIVVETEKQMTNQKDSYPIMLDVPYIMKDIAKGLGASWDPICKIWYVDMWNEKAIINLVDFLPEDEHVLRRIAKWHGWEDILNVC
jgi:hypothetical protein